MGVIVLNVFFDTSNTYNSLNSMKVLSMTVNITVLYYKLLYSRRMFIGFSFVQFNKDQVVILYYYHRLIH